MKFTVRQIDVLRYLMEQEKPVAAWKVARDVLAAPRNDQGLVRSQGAVNVLIALQRRGFVDYDGMKWEITEAGHNEFTIYAFSEL